MALLPEPAWLPNRAQSIQLDAQHDGMGSKKSRHSLFSETLVRERHEAYILWSFFYAVVVAWTTVLVC